MPLELILLVDDIIASLNPEHLDTKRANAAYEALCVLDKKKVERAA